MKFLNKKGEKKKMKTTIKKMIKLGLKENDIKNELNLNEKKYDNMKKWNTAIEVDNLTELLEKYNSNDASDNNNEEVVLADSQDILLSKKIDEVYSILGLENLDMTIKEKSDIVKNIPNFIENIRKEIGKSKIKELEKKIDEIKLEISKIEKEYNLLDESKDESRNDCIEEIQMDKFPDVNVFRLKFDKDIKMQSSNYYLGKEQIMVRVSKEKFDEIKENDFIVITRDSPYDEYNVTYDYKVLDKRESGHIRYMKLILS